MSSRAVTSGECTHVEFVFSLNYALADYFAVSHTFQGVTSFVEVRRMRKLAAVNLAPRSFLISRFQDRATSYDREGNPIREHFVLGAYATPLVCSRPLLTCVPFSHPRQSWIPTVSIRG